MKVAVIGATGHIGTWLVPRLVARGHEVTAISRGLREPYHHAREWSSVRHVVLDRTASENDGSFGERIARIRSEVIIDLTCFTPDSAAQLVDAVRETTKLFVHCGTLWVHGVPESRPYDETAPRKPFGEYGINKAAIEEFLLSEASSGFPATILHPGHITGPGWDPINPAGNLDRQVFNRLATGEEVALPDDGLATLQHVHADDVAQAFALVVDQPAKAIGESFHVAASEPVTLRSYAEQVANWYERDARLAFLPWDEWKEAVSERDAFLSHDHMAHSPHASIEKARRVLGFEPRYTAVEAARHAILKS